MRASEKTRRLTGLALMTAIIVVLQVVASFVKFGPFTITLALAPILIGAALYGPKAGACLGGVFGAVVLLACILGWDPGGAILWNANPFLTALVCLGKGILAGLAAGLVYRAIAAVCTQADSSGISDEIYACLAHDGRTFTSFASLSADAKERTILVNGVSKAYAMTGWRIGYACANVVIAKVMANYVSHSTGSPVAISQRAAAVALSGSQAEIETMRQAFEQRRNYIVERMNAIPGVSCIQPEGAFYVMMNLEQLLGKTIHGVEITNDDVFADAFLKYGLVAVVPGSGFGAPNFVRWSYATSMENIKEGLDRLEKFLAE